MCRSFTGSISRQEGTRSRQGEEGTGKQLLWTPEAIPPGTLKLDSLSEMSQIKARNTAFGALRNQSLGMDAIGKKVDFLEPGSFLQPEAQLSCELSAATSPERWAEAPPQSYMEGQAAEHQEQTESRSVHGIVQARILKPTTKEGRER